MSSKTNESRSNQIADDIRMRGFTSRHTVATAWDWIDAQVRPLDAESVELTEAYGRVLAADVVSSMDVPQFDRSAMDGYAVRAAETIGASDYHPVTLQVIDRSFPGHPAGKTLSAGQAIRIMTGAPMPAGADAVVPAEYATAQGDLVELTLAVSARKNVGCRGEDVASGTTLLQTGQVLRPQDVGLLASIGRAEVSVTRRPRVRLIVTGNELVLPGTTKTLYQIYEANSFIVRGLIARDGGIAELCWCRDDPAQIRDALTKPSADVLLISGGSSVGAEDHAPQLVRELGELPLHGLAMRPSSPAGLGRIGSSFVFLLPGNPVSCLCAYDFFAGRAIRRLGGRSIDWPYALMTGTLTNKIASQVGRVDYCRVRITGTDIEPLSLSGASILSSTTRANGFVVVPEMSEGFAAGTVVTAFRY